MYVGEGLTIVCAAVNPLTNDVIPDATGEVEFYAVGANPAKVTDDRVVDTGPYAMTFDDAIVNGDSTVGAYRAEIDTTGWAPGKRAYKVTLTGTVSAWAYGTIKLDA